MGPDPRRPPAQADRLARGGVVRDPDVHDVLPWTAVLPPPAQLRLPSFRDVPVTVDGTFCIPLSTTTLAHYPASRVNDSQSLSASYSGHSRCRAREPAKIPEMALRESLRVAGRGWGGRGQGPRIVSEVSQSRSSRNLQDPDLPTDIQATTGIHELTGHLEGHSHPGSILRGQVRTVQALLRLQSGGPAGRPEMPLCGSTGRPLRRCRTKRREKSVGYRVRATGTGKGLKQHRRPEPSAKLPPSQARIASEGRYAPCSRVVSGSGWSCGGVGGNWRAA
jgi:hypothetical protein